MKISFSCWVTPLRKAIGLIPVMKSRNHVLVKIYNNEEETLIYNIFESEGGEKGQELGGGEVDPKTHIECEKYLMPNEGKEGVIVEYKLKGSEDTETRHLTSGS